MTWTLYPAKTSFAQFADLCDELNTSLFKSHPFLSSIFIGALIEYFAVSKNDLLAIHSSEGKPDGLMVLTKNRVGVWSTFRPSQAQIGPVLLPAGVDFPQLIRLLPGWNIALEILCQDPLYSDFADQMLVSRCERIVHLKTIRIDVDGDFDEYWQGRNAKLRENIRRYLRRVEKDGSGCQLNVIVEPWEVSEALIRYGELESAGWKGRENTAIHQSNVQGKFYGALLKQMSARGQARLYELYIGGNLAASQICINNENILILLKTTYDEKLSKLSPGRLMQYFLLKHIFDSQIHSGIEFYTNAKQEDEKWSTASRQTYHFTEFRNRPVRWLISGVRNLRNIISK